MYSCANVFVESVHRKTNTGLYNKLHYISHIRIGSHSRDPIRFSIREPLLQHTSTKPFLLLPLAINTHKAEYANETLQGKHLSKNNPSQGKTRWNPSLFLHQPHIFLGICKERVDDKITWFRLEKGCHHVNRYQY